jgi:hypothetical protein
MAAATVIAIISAVVSIGTAIYSMSLKPDDPEDIGASVTKQGSQSSRNRVYGKCRVSCSNVYSNVLDTSTNVRLDVFQMAGVGKLKYIHQLYIDDKTVLEDDGGVRPYYISTDPDTPDDGIYTGLGMGTNGYGGLTPAFQKQGVIIQFRNGSLVE